MAVEAFEDIRRDARKVLQDDDKVYWTDDELDLYINEAQDEFCKKTRSLRAQTPITSRENQEVYTIPDEAIEVIRFEDVNGSVLQKTSSSALRVSDGDNFRTVIGNPSHVYSDLDGENKFRFFPRPKPPIDVGSHVVEPSILSLEPGFGNLMSLTTLDDKIFMVDERNILIVSDDLRTIRAIDHSSINLGTIGTHNITIPSAHRLDTSLAFGTFLQFEDNPVLTAVKIFKVDKFGTFTLLTTSADISAITIGVPLSRNAPRHVIYGNPINYFAANLGTGAETLLESVQIFQGAVDSFDTNKSYLALGTNGVKTVDVAISSPGPGSLVTLTTEKVFGISMFFEDPIGSNSRIFVNHDGTLGEMNPTTGVITDTTVTGISKGSTSGQIYSDGVSIFAQRIVGAVSSIIEIQDGAVVRTYDSSAATPTSTPFMIHAGTVDGLFVQGGDPITPRIAPLYSTDLESGAIIQADLVSFDSDEGAVIDVFDDEDSIFFDSEEGAVVEIFDAEDQGTIWYARKPIKDRIEIRETRALTEYTLHRAFEKEFDQKNLVKASYHFVKFLDVVARENRRQLKGYINDRSPVRTYFF